jgi:hypothetical protein
MSETQHKLEMDNNNEKTRGLFRRVHLISATNLEWEVCSDMLI